MKQFLYFSATWCGPCKQYKSTLLQLGPDINIKHYDVNQYPQETERYAIKNVPTMILEVNGQEKVRLVGVKSASELTEIYNKY